MPQHVAKGADFLPWLIRHQMHGHFSRFGSCLADALKAAFDPIADQSIFFEGRSSMPWV